MAHHKRKAAPKRTYDTYWATGHRIRIEQLSKPPVEVPRHRAKKDTRRWCLGHEGREHEWWYVDADRWHWGNRPQNVVESMKVCKNCKKHAPWGEAFGRVGRDGWPRDGRTIWDEANRRYVYPHGPAF